MFLLVKTETKATDWILRCLVTFSFGIPPGQVAGGDTWLKSHSFSHAEVLPEIGDLTGRLADQVSTLNIIELLSKFFNEIHNHEEKCATLVRVQYELRIFEATILKM